MGEQKIIIPESLHYYTHLGEPVPEVPRGTIKKVGICPSCSMGISVSVKGDKSTCPECKTKIDVSGFENITMRDTTTSDAIKFGLFPSVSLLSTYGDMPIELSNWYKTRLVNFVMDNYSPNRQAWWNSINRDIKALENEYADRGTMIHGHIQKALSGEVVSGAGLTSLRAIDEIREWEQSLDLEKTVREQGHCDPILGFGGTIDVDGYSGIIRIVGDYKTKHSASSFDAIKGGNRKVLWSAIKQLAGYGNMVKADEAYVIPIRVDDNHEETGETLFIKLTKDERYKGLSAIIANQAAWCANLYYYPQEFYKQGLCWSLEEIMNGKRD